jgi:SAM-dependent methyltransferase
MAVEQTAEHEADGARARPHRGRILSQSWSIDRVTYLIIAVVSAGVAVLHVFGLLSVPVLAERLPELTLLVAALTLTFLAVTTEHHMQRSDQDLARLRNRIVSDSAAIGARLDELSQLVRQAGVTELPKLIEEVDPTLLAIFRRYLENVFETPPRLLNERRFQLEDIESYPSYHRQALEANPGVTMHATSLPYGKFFWHNAFIQQATEKFVRDGGTIRRIFFVQGDHDLRVSSEVRDILRWQHDGGVEVYVIDVDHLPPSYRRFVLVDATHRRFGWEAHRGADDRIIRIEVTAHSEDIRAYLKLFDDLLAMGAVRYEPNRTLALRRSSLTRSPSMSVQPAIAFHEFEHAQWQTAVEPYHEAWGRLTRQTIPALLDALHAGDGIRLLDVACGPGYLAAEARSRGAVAVGVDFSEAMVARATALYPEIEFQEGDAENLPFADATFDAVGMNFGMLHLAQPELAIGEAFRVLRAGGRFAFSVWSSPDQAVAFALVLQALRDHGQPVTLPAGPDFFRYSVAGSCIDDLRRAGFHAPEARLVEMRWRMDAAGDVFDAFYRGTARTGALLRGQSRQTTTKIEGAVTDAVARLRAPDGGVEIPMAAMLAWGLRP